MVIYKRTYNAKKWSFILLALREERSNTSFIAMEGDIAKFREFGKIYGNVKTDHVKDLLLQSAPSEILDSYAIVTKNILFQNIKLNPEEFELFKPHKEALKELGLHQKSAKRRREILAEGNLFQALSDVMSKLATPRSAYEMRS